MELVLLFAFAVVFAILLNFSGPKVQGYFPSLAANYWGSTLLTAVMVLILLVVVSFVFAEVGVKEP